MSRIYDYASKCYSANARYVIGEEVQRRLTLALLDSKVFYQETGGLNFGIIGGFTDLLVYNAANALAKTKASITVRDLLVGVSVRDTDVFVVSAQEAMWRQAGDRLDALVAYMMSFPALTGGVRPGNTALTLNANGDLLYRGKVVRASWKKSGLLSVSQLSFECEGLVASDHDGIKALIDRRLSGVE